jgi:phosphoglucan,water dikinase
LRAIATPSPAPNHPEPFREDSFVAQLVSRNNRARSWREKLDLVHSLLADEARELTQPDLADLAIYLRFLSTGEIPCLEDGRHFRPSHHARLATQIHARLVLLATPENTFLVRKILACLPSTAGPFQRAEPLTRIRDIAHRNDIPQDLKREIKTTLQNKLHRCAGPEDLATSAALLERITATTAQYSADFVEQFRIFHGELSEFFNARSLEERLRPLAAGTDDATRELIQHFLEQKQWPDLDARRTALAQLTELRRRLLALADQQEGGAKPELRLTDIALEDFAFTLLSEILNALPPTGKPAGWNAQFDTLALTLANLASSRIAQDEAQVIEAELKAGRTGFSPENRDQLLRLKATVERSRRLAGDFSDGVLVQLAARAETLGRALGVAPNAIRVFAEGEIRGHLVFQLAKVASDLLRRLRARLDQPSWDVLVTGQATGRFTPATTLGELSPAAEPLVVLLAQAEGDEEIPADVAGIILAHELPHLSHLGVRARQAGVTFVSCEESALTEDLRRYAGQWVLLQATPEGIQLGLATDNGTPARPQSAASIPIPEVQLQPPASVLPVEKILSATGGNKADGARRLLELAARKDADFTAPAGLVVPFGVMEQALRSDSKLHAHYSALVGCVNELPPGEFAAATVQLRELVARLPVPDEINAAVVREFGRARRLAVRSSANSEDLPHLAGAGLHESVIGVAAEAVAQAVSTVWASLWTERAAASRRQAGIPHEAAHMAVLIQPLVEPELSFILHTVNPVSHNPRECYVELVVGLGETLASAAARGTPYRLLCDKESGRTTPLAFASFSHALEVQPDGRLVERRVDYSRFPFTTDAALRAKLGARLAIMASFLERAFGVPQDVEGVVRGEEIILVQSRPQQGIPHRA